MQYKKKSTIQLVLRLRGGMNNNNKSSNSNSKSSNSSNNNNTMDIDRRQSDRGNDVFVAGSNKRRKTRKSEAGEDILAVNRAIATIRNHIGPLTSDTSRSTTACWNA